MSVSTLCGCSPARPSKNGCSSIVYFLGGLAVAAALLVLRPPFSSSLQSCCGCSPARFGLSILLWLQPCSFWAHPPPQCCCGCSPARSGLQSRCGCSPARSVAAPGCSWLLLAASGCSWLLLVAPGCCWILLVAFGSSPGCSWVCPVASGCSWLVRVLAAPRFSWLLVPFCMQCPRDAYKIENTFYKSFCMAIPCFIGDDVGCDERRAVSPLSFCMVGSRFVFCGLWFCWTDVCRMIRAWTSTPGDGVFT